MNAPILTFRGYSAPYDVLTSITYVQTKDGGTNLPVLAGENSDTTYFRIYNNWELSSNIASALNVSITTYDGAGIASHTASTLPVSQLWIHAFLNGYGENSVTPGVYTAYVGVDTAIGGSDNVYVPEKGSDGVLGEARIRAGSDYNGVGFLELSTYASVPASTPNITYLFAIACEYEWTS